MIQEKGHLVCKWLNFGRLSGIDSPARGAGLRRGERASILAGVWRG